MYHEYTYNGRLHRRSYSSSGRFEAPRLIDPESELGRLRRDLMARLGREGFYEFHLTLGDHVVLNERLLLEATRKKLDELDRSATDWVQLTLQLLTD